jgi:hypothetical protein
VDIEVIGEHVRHGLAVDCQHTGTTLAEDPGILQLDEDVGPITAAIAEIQTEPGQQITLLAAVEVEILLRLIASPERPVEMKAWRVETFLSSTDADAREPQADRGQASAPALRRALPAH